MVKLFDIGKDYERILHKLLFQNIEYDDGFYGGVFSSPDSDVYFEFIYDRGKKEFVDIWNNSKPIEEILPIPIWWLDKKLEENGELRKNESKISY